MQMTQEQAFKAGFLLRCAEEGLTIDETHARVKQAIAEVKMGRNVLGIEKTAFIPQVAGALGSLGSNVGRLGGSLISAVPGLLSTGAMIGIGAPVAAGAGTGYLAARLTKTENKDALEEAKHDEILGEYERLAEEAKRRALLKRIQAQTGKRLIPMSPSLGI